MKKDEERTRSEADEAVRSFNTSVSLVTTPPLSMLRTHLTFSALLSHQCVCLSLICPRL